MAKIIFQKTGQKAEQGFEVPDGTSVLDCAIQHKIALNHDCGGNCACTTCQIFVEDGAQNLEPIGEDERGILEANDKVDPKIRLGCQSRVKTGTVVVKIPE